MYVCIIYVHVCMHAWMYVYMHACMHACIACMYVCNKTKSNRCECKILIKSIMLYSIRGDNIVYIYICIYTQCDDTRKYLFT